MNANKGRTILILLIGNYCMCKTKEEILQFLHNNLEEVQNSFGVARIGIFGSLISGEQSTESDVDVLVEFQDGKTTLENFFDLKAWLEMHLQREIDLVTRKALHPEIKNQILKALVYV